MALLAQMLKKRHVLVSATVLLSILAAAVTLWWNAQLSAIINNVSRGHRLSEESIPWALVTMCLTSALAYAKSYMAGLTSESMTHDMRMGYARHFASLPFSEVECLNAGEQLSKLQNEIADVSGYLNNNLFQLFDDSVRFFATFGWLFVLSPGLTLRVNLPAFVIMVYVFYSSRVIGAATGRSQQAKGQMNGFGDTMLTLFPIIRLYGAARLITGGYDEAVREWEGQTARAERVKARLMSLSGLLSSVPLMLLLLIGGTMAINGTLAIGTVYVFLNLSGNVSGVMMNMPSHIASFRQFGVNMKRLVPYVLLSGREEGP